VEIQVPVVVIDLKNNGCAFKIERAKIMLAVRIIGITEIVKGSDGVDKPTDGFCSKCG
jgi:hypothetical protein